MKLLLKLQDKDEALSIKYRLELSGIPIFIGSENSGPALGFINADCYTIWAEIDAQYKCAISSINDKSYEPLNPVNIDNFRIVQEGQVQAFRDKFSKVNEYILNILAVGGIAWLVFVIFPRG